MFYNDFDRDINLRLSFAEYLPFIRLGKSKFSTITTYSQNNGFPDNSVRP